MKVAFFLKNELLKKIKWSNVDKGNPGVGGSEYIIVLTAYALSKNANYDVTLITQKEAIFPIGLKVAYAENLRGAIDYCDKNGISYLTFKEYPRWINEHCFDNLKGNVGLIVWCHNFLSSSLLNFYAGIPSVKSVICVGREQADLYRDHVIFKKLDYIYNGFPIPMKRPTGILPANKRQNIVTYIGSIMPFKGFHLLAKAWPMILKYVPDAQLYIIGSGQVYQDDRPMGRYNIADEEYERLFMPYLTTSDGKILPSVHFMGRMGAEKDEIVKMTKVGVPNPSGDTETFGIGAVEFGIMGCEVVTRRCCGYLDTVYNKQNLYGARKAKSLAKYIIKALKNPSTNYDDMFNDIKSRFAIEKTSSEWDKLFNTLERGGTKIHDLDNNIPNKCFRWKWLRIIYARFNRMLGYKLPCMTRWSENPITAKIRWIMNKYY